MNALGWGGVLPFEVIYLHDGRGFGLGTAGFIVGALTGVAVVAAPVAGPLIDRLGARTVSAGAGVALAGGYAGLAFAHSPTVALVAAVVGGIGNGALNPAQSTLLAALAPPTLRHRVTAISRVATNAGFGFGGALGGVVAAHGVDGLVALLLVNAATYVVYVAVLFTVVEEAPPTLNGGARYGTLLRDRAFLHLALTNVAVIAVGWGVLPWVVPAYAKHTVGLEPQLIGALMLANAATVVIAQVPVARLAEGRRRVAMMAIGAAIFSAACLLILEAKAIGPSPFAALVVAAVAIAIGECFHTCALMPLVAELAPPHLRGRYMAGTAFSWWIGLALAPSVGTQLLAHSPRAAFGTSAAVAAAAALSMLALDRRLPGSMRHTPHAAAAAAGDRV